ncbi:MAG: carbon-nitrogen hydrolase family protein [Pseudomonadota bacterium]
MKISLIQMNSQENKSANLAAAERLIGEAVADDRPDLIVLPEMFTHLSESRDAKRLAAEAIPGGEAYAMLSGLAQRYRVFIHGGSLLERDGDNYYNTSLAFGRDGGELARYRKIHLFDVVTPDGKEYRESASVGRGERAVTYAADGVKVGCSICYDLRFPELYLALAKDGAEVIMVPAAFTMATGKDHWEVLLRARAIETQTYVLAAAQCGTYANGRRASFGHSLVADPWGHVIAMADDRTGFVSARLDFRYLKDIRRKLPIHQHRVL